MAKKTLSINLDDVSLEDDNLVSSILDTKQKQSSIDSKVKSNNIINNTINNKTLDDQPSISTPIVIPTNINKLSLSDIPIIKSNNDKKKKKISIKENNKLAKVAKLDEIFNVSNDDTKNSLINIPVNKGAIPITNDLNTKLESICNQINKIKNKINKRGAANTDKKYLDSLDILLKKKAKYTKILNTNKNNHLDTNKNNHLDIDIELERVNNLLNNTKYKYSKSQPNTNVNTTLLNADNITINKLKSNSIHNEKEGYKSIFSVKSNIQALKEDEKLLSKQKKRIQDKLEFKKRQLLKSKQQEQEIKKIKSLDAEKRRLFELDKEVKRLDRLQFQQNREMKNTMQQISTNNIISNTQLENIKKGDHISIQNQKRKYPIHKPYIHKPYIHNNNDKATSNIKSNNEPTILNKIHNQFMNTAIGEKVLFTNIIMPTISNNINNNVNQQTPKNNNVANIKGNRHNELINNNNGYKYIKCEYIDTNIDWYIYKNMHDNSINSPSIEIELLSVPLYNLYLDEYCGCKKDNFTNIIKSNIDTTSFIKQYERPIYNKTPLDDRKSELCQYLGIKKKDHLDTILKNGVISLPSLKQDNSIIILLKILYGCFEMGNFIICNNNTNKLFSQKTQIIESIY